MEIEIHDTQLETRTSKQGKPYSLQTAYAHLTDRHGNPERFPAKINIWPSKDAEGNPVPYPKGTYLLADSSFRVDQRGFLEIGFVNLVKSQK